MFRINSIIILLILATNLYSQHHFKHLSVDDGLSQSTVYDIIKDHDGFMWFCTDYGLDRYDGVNFKIYTTQQNENSLPSDRIYCIVQNREGNFWIGTDNGLSAFNPVKEKFTNYHAGNDSLSLAGNLVFDLFTDEAGILWIATGKGLQSWNEQEKYFRKHLDGEYDIRTIFQDPENKEILWCGSFNNGLVRYDTNSEEHSAIFLSDKEMTLSGESCIRKINTYNGTLVVATDDGLFFCNKTSGQILKHDRFIDLNYTFSSNQVMAIEPIDEKTLWVGSYTDGIIVFDNNLNRIENIRYNPENTLGLSNNRILSIFKDSNGVMWVGTNSRGLNIINTQKGFFTLYNNDVLTPSKLTSNEIWNILKDEDDVLWIGTDKGLNKYDRKTGRIEWITTANSDLSHDDIFSIARISRGELWLGTRIGIDIYDPVKKSVIETIRAGDNDSYLKNVVLTLFKENDQILWAGTFDGLLKIDINSRKIVNILEHIADDTTSLTSTGIFKIENAIDGYLWVGSDNGLNLLNKNTLRVEKRYFYEPMGKGISNNRIYSILKESENVYWFGSFGGGIDRFDFDKNEFMNLRESNGLANNVVYGIIQDNSGDLWISTNYGISNYDQESNVFTNYTIIDGLQSFEFNYGAYFKAEDDEIFFGGVNGLNSFYPSKIAREDPGSKMVITGITISSIDKEGFHERKIDLAFINEKKVELNHYENFFTIHYSPLNYDFSGKYFYAYKINEINDNFINNEERNYASFNGLPPGEYNITILASKSRAMSEPAQASMTILIHPPIWQTTGAYFIYILFFMTSVSSFLLYRRNLHKREIQALEKADVLKSEFLAQMSHEIRSPINIILSYSNLLKDELEGTLDEYLKDSFISINNAGKRIIRTIDLILNMSEIQTGTYDYKPRKLNLYRDILSGLYSEFSNIAKGKKLTLLLVNKAVNPFIYADEYTVNQIFANLIDNAIKYTDKGKVEIIIKANESGFVVDIADTGKGIKDEYIPHLFSPFSQEEQGYTRDYEGNGLGLALVKKYCDINSAHITIKSKKGDGSIFSVHFKKAEEI